MASPDIAIIVPARLASVRFPRKLLHPVKGVPLILWTARRIRQAAPGMPLHFAVAEQELADVLAGEGFSAILTDPELSSGTDRLAAANRAVGARHVINVQADEPLVSAKHIEALARMITGRNCAMATLGTPFRSEHDFRDPNRVKALRGIDGLALYFSRSPIPYPRDAKGQVTQEWLAAGHALLHLGLYAYTQDFLARFPTLPRGVLEEIEKLEQLRALENGYRIAIDITHESTVGVDTPSDVPLLEARL